MLVDMSSILLRIRSITEVIVERLFSESLEGGALRDGGGLGSLDREGMRLHNALFLGGCIWDIVWYPQ
jgi:hypothetical protein